MATYPESPVPVYPLEIEPQWDTLVSTMDSGKEQRRQKTLFPKYDVRPTYRNLTAAGIGILWDFYMARRGAFEPFYIYDMATTLAGLSFTHKGQFVGVADGVTDTFDIPGKATASHAIYIGGEVQSGNYTILTGGGESAADRLQFTAAPVEGGIITADFAGALRMRVRFREDKLTRSLFKARLFAVGVDLKGLGPA
jgi:hypothetical protein